VKTLVIGSGGREHAIAWKLLQSPKIEEVVCIPGNGGTATLAGCRNLALSPTDFEGIARVALVNNLALVVVGPEQPLAAGIVDALQAEKLAVLARAKRGHKLRLARLGLRI
jgi:phosphoribosylamine--glycine ligase